MGQHVTIGRIAQLAGAFEAQIRKLANRGKIPYDRVGSTRVFNLADVDTIRAACIEAGYVKAENKGPALV